MRRYAANPVLAAMAARRAVSVLDRSAIKSSGTTDCADPTI